VRITNNHNLPRPIVSAIEKMASRRPSAGNDISVTRLIGSPQIRRLEAEHFDKIEEDASGRVWALLGSAVHAILETADTKDYLSEESLGAMRGGWLIRGRPDLLSSDGVLTDYKVTSVWSVIYGKDEWETQLNMYAWLYSQAGFTVNSVQVIALMRDWVQRRKGEDGYPDCQIVTIDIPLWESSKCEQYIDSQLARHGMPDSKCTLQERWAKPDSYAVKKHGNKRAIRVFDHKPEAEAYIAGLDDQKFLHIEERQGDKFARCKQYCSVAKFCEQYKGGVANGQGDKREVLDVVA